MATKTIQGVAHITVECSRCGKSERFFGANMREVFDREEAAGWQHSPVVVGGANCYMGTCDPCSEDPMLGVE